MTNKIPIFDSYQEILEYIHSHINEINFEDVQTRYSLLKQKEYPMRLAWDVATLSVIAGISISYLNAKSPSFLELIKMDLEVLGDKYNLCNITEIYLESVKDQFMPNKQNEKIKSVLKIIKNMDNSEFQLFIHELEEIKSKRNNENSTLEYGVTKRKLII